MRRRVAGRATETTGRRAGGLNVQEERAIGGDGGVGHARRIEGKAGATLGIEHDTPP